MEYQYGEFWILTSNCLLFSKCTNNVLGIFSKKQYASSAAQRFMRKLCTERCREWTRLALFLSKSLIHSMM